MYPRKNKCISLRFLTAVITVLMDYVLWNSLRADDSVVGKNEARLKRKMSIEQ